MKRKLLITFLSLSYIILFWNCTDMYDDNLLPYSNSKDLTNFQLSELLESNKKVYEKSNLSLISVKELDTTNISIDMFLNNDFDCFPIYEINMQKFHLVDWNFFQQDTVLVHFKGSYIQNYLSSLLENKDEYITKELIWKNHDKEVKTIALFNKDTGELEYDNIIFNSFTQPSKSYMLSRNITRVETGGVSGFEQVSITASNGAMATAKMSWSISGIYETIPVSTYEGIVDTIIFIPYTHLKNSILEIPDTFPDRNWYNIHDYVQGFGGQASDDYKSYYVIKFGIGTPDLMITEPPLMVWDYHIYQYLGEGYGYSYKSRFPDVDDNDFYNATP